MAIPKIKEQDIIDALKYIDENGVPSQNQSTKYELVTEEGKKYPPKLMDLTQLKQNHTFRVRGIISR